MVLDEVQDQIHQWGLLLIFFGCVTVIAIIRVCYERQRGRLHNNTPVGETNEGFEMSIQDPAPPEDPTPPTNAPGDARGSSDVQPGTSDQRITRSQTRPSTASSEGARQRNAGPSGSSPAQHRWSNYLDDPEEPEETTRPDNVPPLDLSEVEWSVRPGNVDRSRKRPKREKLKDFVKKE